LKTVVSDASPIVAFTKKGELSLLKILFTAIHLPKVVYNELINEEGASELQIESVKIANKDKWIIVDDSCDSSQLDRYRIGGGEQDAIAACMNKPESYLLLIDDKKAKQIAKDHHIQTLGTLGIIGLAFTKRLRDKMQAIENVQRLLREGFHLSSDVVVSFTLLLEKKD
jgi:predicted nucleic acid-binding protein